MNTRRPPEQRVPFEWSAALRAVALLGLLIAALLPASAGIELFPWWDLDPTTRWTPSTGIQPWQMLMLAMLSVAGAGLAMLAGAVGGERPLWGHALLAGIGSAGVLAHGVFDTELHGDGAIALDGVEHLVRAAPWIAMIWGWVGAAHLCRGARARTIVLALAIGFVVLLLAKGLLQIVIEHPATVAEFERTKDDILASNGWEADSPAALAYERRLLQPEASGWFGLSNVYASFMAAAAAGLIAACASAFWSTKKVTRSLAVAVGIALCALVGLLLSKSKGGIGAAAISLGACALVALVTEVRRARPDSTGRFFQHIGQVVGRLVGPGVIVLVLGLIAVRGVIGTDFGERSLLFRAFYAVGSLRIWGEHPLFGVGPDGFQDAYAAAKLPIATETVQSPHSVLLDWTATLGVFGLAWATLLIWRSAGLFGFVRAGASGGDTAAEPAGAAGVLPRSAIQQVVLVVALVGLGGTAIEQGLATPSFALARVLGIVGWLVASIGLLRWMNASRSGAPDAARTTGWLAAGSAVALIAHMQIEVTPVWVNAAPLLGVWLGAAMPGPKHRSSEAGDAVGNAHAGVRGLAGWIVGGLCALSSWIIAVMAVGIAIPGVWQWQAALAEAAVILQPAAELQAERDRVFAEGDRAGLERLAGQVSVYTGASVPARPEAVGDAVHRIRLFAMQAAMEPLARAQEARPGHSGTRITLGRVALELAANTPADDLDQLRLLLEPIVAGQQPDTLRPRSIGMWDWSGIAAERAATLALPLDGGEVTRMLIDAATLYWLEVDARSPYSARAAIHLMDLHRGLGDIEFAQTWAAEALDRDDLSGLDPISGLSAVDRDRAERILLGE